MDKPEAVKVFYSYSHRDEELRNELEAHLSILKRKGFIEEWHDRKILPGKLWDEEIDKEMEQADLILLLVSSDFVASNYCYGVELKKALDRHEANQAIVIPIIIRPTDWQEEVFAKIQALPKDAVAVTTWNNRDEAWLDVAQGIRKAIQNVNSFKERSGQEFGLMSVKELLRENIKAVEKKYEARSHCSGTSSGFIELDRCIDGLHKSDFIVIAARPGMGKTDFLVNLSLNIAIKGNSPIAFFSLRLPADQIMTKMICAEGGVDYLKYSRGFMQETDWPKLLRSASNLFETNIFIDDSPNSSLPTIRSKLKKFAEDKPNSFVIIDSINNLIEFDNFSDDYISHLSRSLKELAKELKITIIVSVPVSRAVDSRTNKRPSNADLEKWSCLNDDADIIAFMYYEQYYDQYTENHGVVDILLSRNRRGPLDTLMVKYIADCNRFEDIKESTTAEEGLDEAEQGSKRLKKHQKNKPTNL